MAEWTHEEMQEFLKKHGEGIGAAHRKGHVPSTKVVEYYKMHHSCPSDPVAFTLLCIAVDIWKRDVQAEAEAAEIGG